MKHVVCIPDGCSDEPLPELDGRTPLEAASMPNLSALARGGELGRATVIPEGLPPGSDVGNMSILGYDPVLYHTGRAPIEAAALGIKLGEGQIAFRCNLVTVSSDGTMTDFAGGHPSTESASRAIALLQSELGDAEVSFHAGVQYRHVVVAPLEWAEVSCTPPHDLSDRKVLRPVGPAAAKVDALTAASREVLSGWGGDANQVWLWGQGRQPVMPSFLSVHGLEGALTTAVDLIRGLGMLTGIEVVEVEGATGWYDTNYEGKRDACLEALAGGVDVFIIHVEATDEAGHAGHIEEKVKALENWDARIIGPLVQGLDALGPWRLLLMPDHPTPLARKTHTMDPVPWLLVDSSRRGPGGHYTEVGTASFSPVAGHSLMGRLLRESSG